MADCVCLPKCPFFHDKMADMPAMADMYKANYCRGDSSKCARHAVFEVLGSGNVPTDLYPNDMARAQSVLAESRT